IFRFFDGVSMGFSIHPTIEKLNVVFRCFRSLVAHLFSMSPEHISRLFLGLVYCFWTILGGILAGFIALEQVLQAFHSWNSVQAKFLEVAGKRVHEASLVTVQLMQASWVLSHLLVALDDMVNRTVEDHEPCRI